MKKNNNFTDSYTDTAKETFFHTKNFRKFGIGLTLLASLYGCAPQNSVQNTPVAQLSYAYLALEEAMKNDDIQTIDESSKTFLAQDPTASPLIEIATYYMSNEDFEKAKELLRQMVEISPQDFHLHLLLAECYVNMSKTESAVTLLEAYLEANPQNANAHLEFAIFLINVKLFEKANALFDSFTTEQITPISLYYHAKSLYASKDLDGAREKLLYAITLQDDFIEALFELALLEEELGNNTEAIKYFEEILQYDPSNLDIVTQLVLMHILNQDYAKALKLANEITDSSTILLQIMPLLMEQGQYNQARKVIEMLENDDEYYEEILFYKAAVEYESERDIAKALKYLYQIPVTSEHYYRALRLIIEFEIAEEMYVEALFHVEKGLEVNPNDIDLFILKIQLYYAMEEDSQAFEFAEDHAKKSFAKHQLSLYDAEVLYHYAGLLIIAERGEEAIEYIEKVLKFVPDHYEAMNSLAYYYAVQNKNIDEAYTIIQEVIENNPEIPHFIDTLAWIQYRMGEYEEAYENINKAINFMHSEQIDPTILAHFGFIAIELGYKDKAKEAFIKALEGEPEEIDKVRKALQDLE